MNAINQYLNRPTVGALSIQNVGKHFQIEGQTLEVLTDISLSVAPGEFVSIVGASGCGKSTLLRLIAGLESATQGALTLDNSPITGTSLDRGLVFQDHRLFPWKTVSQNIALALKNHNYSNAQKAELIAEHIALVGLTGFENAYPHQLSGGMAQRAAIARALINKPKLLLLDEPFGALDALTRVHLQRELQRIWQAQKSSMIMVTHDVEEALYLSDRVVVLDARPGRIKRIIQIDLPHPRERSHPELQRLKDELLEELVGAH